MPKLVPDTSSLIGALLRPGSLPARAWLVARQRFTICLSQAMEDELREVLRRPKLARHLDATDVEAFLAQLATVTGRVTPDVRVADCRDAKDNKVLEAALAAGAEVILSSDDDLAVLHPWRGIAILSPASFVARFDPGPPP